MVATACNGVDVDPDGGGVSGFLPFRRVQSFDQDRPFEPDTGPFRSEVFRGRGRPGSRIGFGPGQKAVTRNQARGTSTSTRAKPVPNRNGYGYRRPGGSHAGGRASRCATTGRGHMRRACGFLRSFVVALEVDWETRGVERWTVGSAHARGFAKKAYRKLEVILKEDVDQLGFRNEILKVSPGYARNYLIPNKLAVIATEDRKSLLDKEMEAALAKKVAERKTQQERFQGLKKVLDKLTSNPIRFERKSVPGGKLYGSITAADVVKEVREQCKVEITESALEMEAPFKSVGFHSIPLRYKIEGLKDYTLQVLIASVEKDDADQRDGSRESSDGSREDESPDGEGPESERKDEEQ